MWRHYNIAVMNRLRFASFVFLVVISSFCSAQKLPQPRLIYSKMPGYPGFAIISNLEGTVKLSFVLDEKGNVSEVHAITGPKILAEEATEDVKSWRFELPRDLFRTEWRYETVFDFRFSGKEVGTNDNPKLTVSLEAFQHIEIVSDKVKPIVQY